MRRLKLTLIAAGLIGLGVGLHAQYGGTPVPMYGPLFSGPWYQISAGWTSMSSVYHPDTEDVDLFFYNTNTGQLAVVRVRSGEYTCSSETDPTCHP